MKGLREAELTALAQLAGDSGQFDDIQAFRIGVPGLLRRLVCCDTAAYNEVGPRPDTVVTLLDPPEQANVIEAIEAFAVFAHQNPLVQQAQQPGEQPALRLSDFIGLSQLKRLELYHHVFRPLEVTHQLALTLSAGGRVIGLTVNRGTRDFSDRELSLLNAAGPYLRASYRNLIERARLAAALAALDEAAGQAHAIVLVDHLGRLAGAHPGAEQLLAALDRNHRASDTLAAWISAQRHAWPHTQPLQLSVDGEPLQARYLPGQPEAVVLSRPARPGGADSLRALGLTHRQAQILQLVWLGHPNEQIARLLDISEHTVRHHLERIYRQLGVASRTAAAQRATQLLTPPQPFPPPSPNT